MKCNKITSFLLLVFIFMDIHRFSSESKIPHQNKTECSVLFLINLFIAEALCNNYEFESINNTKQENLIGLKTNGKHA